PTTGSAPLAVTFSDWVDTSVYSAFPFTIDFGDGSFNGFSPIDLTPQEVHTYTLPGTYSAKLADILCTLDAPGGSPVLPCHLGTAVSTVTVQVQAANAAQPSATIDQRSFTTGSATPTITGMFTSSTGGPAVVVSTQPLPSTSPTTANGVIWNDAGDHG